MANQYSKILQHWRQLLILLIPYLATMQKDDQNGFNWRTPAPDNCDTTDGAGDGTGGTEKGDFSFTVQITNLTIPALEEPKPPTIPHAGVRAGEIMGHRAWLVLRGHRLCSIGHLFVWEPGQVVSGNLDEMVAMLYHMPIYGGVYSFKSRDLCMREYDTLRDWINSHLPGAVTIGDTNAEVLGLAIGTVKLWGEVVIHGDGYRAQYARINSIDEVWGSTVELPLLQGRYLDRPEKING